MNAVSIETNALQKSVAAEEGGNLMTLPERVPIDQVAPPVSAETPPLSFMDSILDADTLSKMEIPKRKPLVGTWWLEGASGFIFGERGKGKSWMGMHLARCLAEGRDCGKWCITEPHRVLYVDGEMALDALKERSKALTQRSTENLRFLSHQYHFDRGGGLLNLSDPAAQQALLEVCQKEGAEVLILDNLSCLFYGMKENESDAWEIIQPWLLDMRRMGIAVCIIHHAGRSGAHMRGTSRREDSAFWIMQVSSSLEGEPSGIARQARFLTQFTKYREGSREDEGPWEWTYETPAEGEPTSVRCVPMTKLDAFIKCIKDGLESCSEIAEELGLGKSTVSKLAQKAVGKNLIKIEGSGNQKRYVYIAEPRLS